MKTEQMRLAKEIPAVEAAARRSSSLRLAWPPPKNLAAERIMTTDEVDTIIAAAKADERKRIGQELHDNVNQILMTVKLYMGMMQHNKKDKCIREKSLSYLMLAIDEIRTLSGEFTHSKKQSQGLVNAIDNIAEDIMFSTPINIAF